MNILLSTDDNYVMPCTVLIESILENNDEGVSIFILYTNLSEENISNLRNDFINRKVQLNFIYFDSEELINLPVSGHISKSAYLRLFFLRLLPLEIDRILYLDCDIIINGKLDELYYVELKENEFIAACEDAVISHQYEPVYQNLDIPINEKYFNSGVVLFDIVKIRSKMNFETLLADTINQLSGKLVLHDQDILNYIFCHKVKFVSNNIYNLFTKEISSYREKRIAIKNTIIFHFADRIKPWDYKYKYLFSELFWEYAQKTRFSNCIYEYNKRRIIYKHIPFWKIRRIKRYVKKF